MTGDEAVRILTEHGMDRLICTRYEQGHPRRIALLRIHHATENVYIELKQAMDFLSSFITNPDEYLADELVVEQTEALVARIHVLEGELKKSLPALSRTEATLAEGADPGLREDPRTSTSQSQEPPPGRPDDWGDVPF